MGRGRLASTARRGRVRDAQARVARVLVERRRRAEAVRIGERREDHLDLGAALDERGARVVREVRLRARVRFSDANN